MKWQASISQEPRTKLLTLLRACVLLSCPFLSGVESHHGSPSRSFAVSGKDRSHDKDTLRMWTLNSAGCGALSFSARVSMAFSAHTLVPVFAPPSIPPLSTTVSCAAVICCIDNACHWYTPPRQKWPGWYVQLTLEPPVTNSTFYPTRSFNGGNKTHCMKSFLMEPLAFCSLLMATDTGAGGGRGAMELSLRIHEPTTPSLHPTAM